MRRLFVASAGMLAAGAVLAAQSRAPARQRPPPRSTTVQEAAVVSCPSELGFGVRTKLMFCDVLTGRDPAQGIIIELPPHRGLLTLRFDLHNRHTYSEEETRSNRGYAAYTATIGALTLDNTLISRAVVFSEFRRETDLLDRIAGGAGPRGIKAVAPVGSESIVIDIPEDVDRVSLLGEKLTLVRADGVPVTYTAPGRPIAVISSAAVEYTPIPVRPRRRR